MSGLNPPKLTYFTGFGGKNTNDVIVAVFGERPWSWTRANWGQCELSANWGQRTFLILPEATNLRTRPQQSRQIRVDVLGHVPPITDLSLHHWQPHSSWKNLWRGGGALGWCRV